MLRSWGFKFTRPYDIESNYYLWVCLARQALALSTFQAKLLLLPKLPRSRLVEKLGWGGSFNVSYQKTTFYLYTFFRRVSFLEWSPGSCERGFSSSSEVWQSFFLPKSICFQKIWGDPRGKPQRQHKILHDNKKGSIVDKHCWWVQWSSR